MSQFTQRLAITVKDPIFNLILSSGKTIIFSLLAVIIISVIAPTHGSTLISLNPASVNNLIAKFGLNAAL